MSDGSFNLLRVDWIQGAALLNPRSSSQQAKTMGETELGIVSDKKRIENKDCPS